MNINIDDGEFMVLVGPSGSGKSTALEWSPGSRTSLKASSRSGTRSSTNASEGSGRPMVFQNYALYPQ